MPELLCLSNWVLRRAVGEFRKLALLAESDGHLRQKLQQVGTLGSLTWLYLSSCAPV